MSIVCKPVEDVVFQRAAGPSQNGYVRANIDPETIHQLNFPIDYKFHEVFLGQTYAEWADRYHNFEIRPDDIWICGYPKSGTVWMQNIVRKLTQNLDFNIPLERAMDAYFELAIIMDISKKNTQYEEMIKRCEEHLERMNQMQSPRIFKSHLSPHLLPKEIWTKKAKVIYMARNPKDAIVSLYHMLRDRFGWKFSMEKIFELCINDEMAFTPIPELILSFWQLRNLDHVLFMTYEELSADRFAGCKKISQFLGYNYDDIKLQALADLVEFKSMRNKMIYMPFYTEEDPKYRHCRKGQVGGYRDEMSQEWIKRFDQWICDRFKNTDFDYLQWM